MEQQAAEQGEEVKINPATVLKPLHKLISDHKDIAKIVIQLQSIVSTIKPEVQTLLGSFDNYSELWQQVCIPFFYSCLLMHETILI